MPGRINSRIPLQILEFGDIGQNLDRTQHEATKADPIRHYPF